MAKHTETAFVPMNLGRRKNKPWFAIACTGWSASQARNSLTENDPRGHAEAWKLLRKDGWRIVKVRIAQQ